MNTFVQTQFEGNRAGLKDVLPLREKITPETFERERDKIFKKSWLMIGHVADLPETGSYFVRELPVVNTSLIVIRGRDGAIRSFHNVCRHRGNKLIRGGEGCKSTITCGLAAVREDPPLHPSTRISFFFFPRTRYTTWGDPTFPFYSRLRSLLEFRQ